MIYSLSQIKWKQAVYFLPFLLLPVWPLAASVLVIIVGLVSLKYIRNYPSLLWGASCFLVLGCVSQVFAPSLPPITSPVWLGEQASENLILPHMLSRMVGFNLEDTQVTGLIERRGEFWRMPRANPATGHAFIELHLFASYYIEAGRTYTQSVFFRHDGTAASFDFNFFTALGYHVVPTTIVDLGDGLKRAYATYQAQEGDEFVRGLDLVNLQGDWTYLEFAYPQLEPSPTPSAYRLSTSERTALVYRLAWVASMSVLGLLGFAGGLFLFERVQNNASPLLVIGMICIFIFVLVEQIMSPYGFHNRAVGLTIHANILGHCAVACAGLVMLGKRHRLTALGFVLALGVIWFSGSRAALIGLAPLLLYWVYTVPRFWRILVLSLLSLGVVAGVWLANLGELGRFTTLFDPNDPTTTSRLGIWQVALFMFTDYPLLGGGLGSFPHFYSVWGTELATDLLASHAHNIFLHLLAETGLLGLVGFLGLLLSIVLVLGKARAWAAIVVIISILVLNLADYTFFNEAIYYPFWLAVAWGASSGSRQRRGS